MTDALTHRRVLQIAVPMVIANVTVPLLGVVDTAVVGQMNSAIPIGAVAIGALILGGIYWIFGFLRMGMTGLAAQAVGRGDSGEVALLLGRGLLVGGLGGAAIFALQVPLFAGWFALSPASEPVENLARQYMAVRVWGAPASVALFAINGWLIALERTRHVLLLQLWMNGLNIALDLLFVMGLSMGVEGVAFATLIAEWTGLGLGLWFCRDGFANALWCDWKRLFDAIKIRHLLSVNLDILIRSVALQTIFWMFVFLSAGFGDVTLAANHVLLLFLEITAFGLDGIAFSAETLVGQAVGKGSRNLLRRSVFLTAVWACGLSVVLAVLFIVLGSTMIDYITNTDEVRLASREYLPWMVLAPIIGAASWLLDGIFIGATRTAAMRNMMLVSVLVYGVSLAILVPLYQNHGLWAALMVSLIARAVTLGMCYPALETDLTSNRVGSTLA